MRYADVVSRLRAAGCVFAEDEAILLIDAASDDVLEGLLARRVAGEPLEHILGWVQFAGLRVGIDPGVFVPRRRTEVLARRAAALAAPGTVVVDLCCGSGAVGLLVKATVPSAEVHAADVSPDAVSCATRNLGAHVHQGDLYDALPADLQGRVQVLVANAPYVPTGEISLMPPEARDFEPHATLDGGADGLDVLRRIVRDAPTWLDPGGYVLFEVGVPQIEAATALCEAVGLPAAVLRDEELGATVVIAQRGP